MPLRSKPKVIGSCTLCDKPCFEVLQVFESHEMNPGEPKRLGYPNEHARAITFRLFDGTHIRLTFCESCAENLTGDKFHSLWERVIRSWCRELDGDHPEWFDKQLSNGILYAINTQKWRELT